MTPVVAVKSIFNAFSELSQIWGNLSISIDVILLCSNSLFTNIRQQLLFMSITSPGKA